MSFGRLTRTPAEPPLSGINITPLVDVMLVLVVLLILTAPLMAARLRLDLPRSEAARVESVARPLVLGLDAQGQVYLEDLPLARVELSRRLVLAARENPLTEVQLRADASVAYGRVVELLGLAQAAGLSRIGFVAQPQPQP